MNPVRFALALVLVLLVGAGVAALSGVFAGPARTVARMQEAHDAHGDLGSRLTSYVSGSRATGFPFTSEYLSIHVERAQTAKARTTWIEGQQVTPWRSITRHDGGAELVDAAIAAADRIVEATSVLEARSDEARSAAFAYLLAREAASSRPSNESALGMAQAALRLAEAIDALRDSVGPAARATTEASAQLDGAVAWCEGAAVDAGSEREVMNAVLSALRVIAAAAQIPERHFDEVVETMAADADALRTVARVGGAT